MTYKDSDKQREAINTCLGCPKAIIQTRGKRQRLWCSDACRIATKRRSEPITEQGNSEQINTEHSITNKGIENARASAVVDGLGVIPKPHKLNQMVNIINEQVLGKSKDVTITKAESHRNEGAMPDDYYEKAKQEMTHNVTERMYEAHKKREGMTKPKRGKDIKCFADLAPDVQQTIDSLSMVDGKICQRVKANRTAIAINYQHLFPDRFHSTGVAV